MRAHGDNEKTAATDWQNDLDAEQQRDQALIVQTRS